VTRDDLIGAVSIPSSQIVELHLAETGTELRAAVEAAQYARLISHDPPASAAEAQAVARFKDAFATCAECWEELEPVRRSGALAGLSAALEALERCGLFVHWAALERRIAGSSSALSMPLALLTIGRTNLPIAHMELPGELEVDPHGGSPIH
jgi:hypothetical protein